MAHRDLKPDNILVEDSMQSGKMSYNVKIIDFGFSISMQGQKKLKTFCGTPSYMSPEIVMKREYDGKSADLWALGILLFNMIYGRCPFRAQTERELYKLIAKGVFSFPDEVYKTDEFRVLQVSSKLKQLIRKILVHKEQGRATCEEILSHEWLREPET